LSILLEEISNILGKDFLGMYLHGSLALKDFVPERSDLDIVIVLQDELSKDQLMSINIMHEKLILDNIPYSDRMECTYIPVNSLKKYSQDKAYFHCLHVGGNFYIDGFGIIEKHVLREKGIVIRGSDPKTFIKPVNEKDLKNAANESLKVWWLPKLKDHALLMNDDYQVYAILTMCRAFYTIKTGEITSKSKAANFVINDMANKYSFLITEALTWKIGNKFNKLQETLDFIEFILYRVGVI
jgi:hypothetical protein